MPSNCGACKYWRIEQRAGILGTKRWCSNSKTPNLLTETAEDFSCDGFENRGRAPIVRFFKNAIRPMAPKGAPVGRRE